MAKKTRNTSASAAYPVEAEALNQQQNRLRKAAASAAAALKGANTANSASTGVVAPTVAQEPIAPVPVTTCFQLHRPGASEVCLAGDFNSWSSTATPLQRNPEGIWQTALPLAPGRYQYKFVVDGEWIADPSAAESAANEFGSVNSVVTIK